MNLKKKIAALVARIVGSPDKKRLFENFFSLSVLQAANYILPLITFPYLVRVLGPDKWGLITFAQAFIQYFMILTDYGFNLSATRDISLHRDDKAKIAEIFSAVTFIKLVFVLASFVAMAGIVLGFNKFRVEWPVYFLTFGMVVGNMLFPVWFFQGMERMKYITLLNILFRSIFTVSIFIFVRQASDYHFVPLLNTLGFMVAGVLGFRIVLKEFGVKLTRPEWRVIRCHLTSGWHTFISGVAISMYTVTNTFLLGLFTNDTIVGYYTAAERVYLALAQLFNPLYQALYPYIVKLVKESREKTLNLLNKLLFFISILTCTLWLILFLFARPLLNLLLGNAFEESVIIFKILSPLIIVVPIAYIFFYLALLAFKLDRYYSRIYLIGGLLNLSLVFIFLVLMGMEARGVALAGLLNQTLITGFAYIVLFRNQVKLFPRLSRSL